MEKIIGINPVLEYLKQNEDAEKVFFLKGTRNKRVQEIVDIVKSKKILYTFVPEEKLKKIADNERHQGVVLQYSGFKYQELENLDYSVNSLIVLLDQITDPHNLGAIIRSAVASGVEAVIIPERNSVSVDEVVVKVSAGTAYKVPIVKVNNLNQTINYLKENGFWIVGTDGTAKELYNEYDFSGRHALVMGSEGKGMRRLVRENCDTLVKIPLLNGVESLNVSVAASVIFFEAAKNK